uniref:Sine oculis binding protein homolog (Drosophila) a n=1 Tax=Oryzias latipes TaxID=8090 RepID=H2MVM0_ORYLA
MAEMEKEGRPPENKRSRKPAHPVKREINEEMKVKRNLGFDSGNYHGRKSLLNFAENTMNELLGWYGYDKVELRESDNLEIGETPQHTSILKENLLPKIPASVENSEGSPDRANSSMSLPASRNGGPEASTMASTTTPSSKEHGNLPVMGPMIPPALIKPPADEDASNVQIMCAWCQKVGNKRYSLSMGSELKSFCSEKCFAACRRAYFKRNKVKTLLFIRKILQHSFTQDRPRLVFKTNSDMLVCDWCKHIRHTKEYLDFGAGERRLQFCSAKCLNQYKMDIFYKETQASLPGALCNPAHAAGGESKPDCGGGVQLLTPESWGAPLTDIRSKPPSPGGPSSISALAPSISSAPSPPDMAGVCSPSSTSAKILTPRPHESSALVPPPVPNLHPPVGVPSGSPPMVMTPRGPMPLPLFMEHQMIQQIRPPFFRPSSHPAGPNSPLSNPIIPGIGPPPPSFGPTASSMHRPLLSPHVHPSSSANPGMIPPHPGLSMTGLPPFPVNMMPNGPIPLSPVMNFGMPSLAPLVPPPTLLVPYPVIVPLPVPIPIPIPIPINSKTFKDQPENSNLVSRAPECSETPESQSLGSPGGSRGEQKTRLSGGEHVSPLSERATTTIVDLTGKAEDSSGNIGLTGGPGLTNEVIDLTMGQRPGQQQVIQRILPGVHVKVEGEADCKSPLAVADSPVSQLSSCMPNLAFPPLPSSIRSQSIVLPQCPVSSTATCNVIVNGTGWRSFVNPAFESCPDRKRDRVGGQKEDGDRPANGDLEYEALKENNCSVGEWEMGKWVSAQDEKVDTVEGKPDPDTSMEEGEHAYTLPLLSAGGCVVIQPVPKPSAEKTAILSCSISTPLSAAGSPELEPPLKRRCLRIRNQNK